LNENRLRVKSGGNGIRRDEANGRGRDGYVIIMIEKEAREDIRGVKCGGAGSDVKGMVIDVSGERRVRSEMRNEKRRRRRRRRRRGKIDIDGKEESRENKRRSERDVDDDSVIGAIKRRGG
jgi:hypothetical protein